MAAASASNGFNMTDMMKSLMAFEQKADVMDMEISEAMGDLSRRKRAGGLSQKEKQIQGDIAKLEKRLKVEKDKLARVSRMIERAKRRENQESKNEAEHDLHVVQGDIEKINKELIDLLKELSEVEEPLVEAKKKSNNRRRATRKEKEKMAKMTKEEKKFQRNLAELTGNFSGFHFSHSNSNSNSNSSAARSRSRSRSPRSRSRSPRKGGATRRHRRK
jgi:chromosome segregation ATPase